LSHESAQDGCSGTLESSKPTGNMVRLRDPQVKGSTGLKWVQPLIG